jgi:hypothetical protein
LIPHVRRSGNGRINALGLSAKVRVKGAKHHPGMVLHPAAMKQQKMLAIMRQHNPVFSNGER